MKGHTKSLSLCSGAKQTYIRNLSLAAGKSMRAFVTVSAGALALLAGMMVFPVSIENDDVKALEGEIDLAEESAITFAAMPVEEVNDTTATDQGAFVSAIAAKFSISTNNYTGYTLSIKPKNEGESNTKLVSENNEMDSILTPVSEDNFISNPGYSNTWGYLPNKYHGEINDKYLPAPTEAEILDATNVANLEQANEYTIKIGARTRYNEASGHYHSDTFVIEYVANPVMYLINYDKNTEDEVTNMPNAQTGVISSDKVTLSSEVPVREGYKFAGWLLDEEKEEEKEEEKLDIGTTVGDKKDEGDVINVEDLINETKEGINVTEEIESVEGDAQDKKEEETIEGTIYQPGDAIEVDTTKINEIKLKAIWVKEDEVGDKSDATKDVADTEEPKDDLSDNESEDDTNVPDAGGVGVDEPVEPESVKPTEEDTPKDVEDGE